MRFMNVYDISDAAERYADHSAHPVLGPASETLRNLCYWANENSDGWAHWPKPARAAAKLQQLIETDAEGRNRRRYGSSQNATVAEYKKALVPIKAFRTKMMMWKGMSGFEIVEVRRCEDCNSTKHVEGSERCSVSYPENTNTDKPEVK